MKNLFLVVSLFASSLLLSQYQKTEISPEEFELITKNIGSSLFGDVDEEGVHNIISQNNSIYIYELQYNGNAIYKGGYNKSNPFSYGMSFGDNKQTSICLPISDLDVNDVLKLLEDSSWKQKGTSANKYICNGSIRLLITDRNRKTVPNVLIPGKLEFKFFKLTEE